MPHQRSDWAHPTATCAPGLGASHCHICTGTGLSRRLVQPGSKINIGVRGPSELRAELEVVRIAGERVQCRYESPARARLRPRPRASNKRSGVGAPARKQHAQTRPRHARAEPRCAGRRGGGLGARVVRAGADGSVIVGGVIKSNMVVILTSINANLPPLSLHDLEARPAGDAPVVAALCSVGAAAAATASEMRIGMRGRSGSRPCRAGYTVPCGM